MISYATFGVRDKATSLNFFEPVLAALGYRKFYDEGTHAGFAVGGDPGQSGTVWIGPPYNGESGAGLSRGCTGPWGKLRRPAWSA